MLHTETVICFPSHTRTLFFGIECSARARAVEFLARDTGTDAGIDNEAIFTELFPENVPRRVLDGGDHRETDSVSLQCFGVLEVHVFVTLFSAAVYA